MVTRKRYAAGHLTSAERTVQFQYNTLGQLQSYNDGQTSANYTFNTLGQLTHITQHFGPFSKTVGYSYTDNGQLKTYTDAESITHTYGYDQSGRLQSIAIPGVGQYTVNDYQWAAPSEITLPDQRCQRRLKIAGLFLFWRFSQVSESFAADVAR